MVGWERGLAVEGTKGLEMVQGCSLACVGKEEVVVQRKGWVSRETCFHGFVMGKVEVYKEYWAPEIIMRESFLKLLYP